MNITITQSDSEYAYIDRIWLDNFNVWFEHLHKAIIEVRAFFPGVDADINDRAIWERMPENLYIHDAVGERGSLGTVNAETAKRASDAAAIQSLRNDAVAMCIAMEAIRREISHSIGGP